jgi:fumarate reductase flavoprotein subunit
MKKQSTSTDWRTAPAPVPDSAIAGEFTADVIVVGLGHAGTPAVRAAAEAGASVIGIEKMERSKYRVFGHDVGHINSRFLAGRGVPRVDPLELFNEWMRRSGNRANPRLVMQFCKKSGEAFDWYTGTFTSEQMATLIVEYWPSGKHFSGEISGQKFWPGTAQFDFKGKASLTKAVLANQERAIERGAQLYFGMEAQQLIMKGKRVAGVVAKDSQGQYIKYTAKKGVILAAGDFGGNPEMCRDLLPDMADLMEEGEEVISLGRDGRGIQMGVWAGGRLEARPLAAMNGNSEYLMGVIDSFGVLWVDENGRRYCNEGFGDPIFAGFPGAQEKRGVKTIVFDSNIFENLQYSPPAHTSFFINNAEAEKRLRDHMASAREAGAKGHRIGPSPGHPPGPSILYAADSLSELADYLGFKGPVKKNFLNNVKRYNEFCAMKRDEDFGKDAQLLHPLVKPPYYGEPKKKSSIGFMLVSCGGLLTDEYQNVLNQKRDPIPGLYATGNCCGRRFGPQYSTPMAGVSIGIAITLGREVGQIAAKLV